MIDAPSPISSLNIRPLRDRVLIAVDPDPTVTKAGVQLIVIERPKILWGEVLAVGPGVWGKSGRKQHGITPGMRVGILRHHAYLELEQREPGEAGREIIVARTDQLQLEELSAAS